MVLCIPEFEELPPQTTARMSWRSSLRHGHPKWLYHSQPLSVEQSLLHSLESWQKEQEGNYDAHVA